MARANFRQIEAFNAVMKGGSVTKAAETLFVSQPAISKLIQSFESSCGFSLFTRGQGRILPTAEARRLFSETEKLMVGVDRIENTARAIREMERGEIAVASYPSLTLRILPHLVARFLRQRPEVHVTLMTRNSMDVANSMLSRAADFGLSLVPTQVPDIVCRPFVEIPMVCALHPDHPQAGRDVVDLSDLAGQPMISLGRADQSHRIVLEALGRAGVAVEMRMEVELADTACALVGEGLGFSIVSAVAATGFSREQVVFRPIKTAPRQVTWLYTSAWGPMPRIAHHLLDTIRLGIEEMVMDTSLREGMTDPGRGQ